jgi:hypothetical protein
MILLENVVAMVYGQQVFGSLHSLAGGQTCSRRLLPAVARAGFLLSPVVEPIPFRFGIDELAE